MERRVEETTPDLSGLKFPPAYDNDPAYSDEESSFENTGPNRYANNREGVHNTANVRHSNSHSHSNHRLSTSARDNDNNRDRYYRERNVERSDRYHGGRGYCSGSSSEGSPRSRRNDSDQEEGGEDFRNMPMKQRISMFEKPSGY